MITIMTILPIKHKIEHKSIKAQTQKYSIKKEQNRTHEKHKNQDEITSPKSTQSDQLSVGRRNEYQRKLGSKQAHHMMH